MEISRAKEIMGTNFIGIDELEKIQLDFPVDIDFTEPEIEYKEEELIKKRNTHVLALCVPSFDNGESITIKNIIKRFEHVKKPCFYNQDWYINEAFINKPLILKWCLVAKELLPDSRGLAPTIIGERFALFSACELVYIFFVYYFHSKGEKLWENDYVWCTDVDDKGDQIYIGRYTDASGFNSDGLEIHRHLKIKTNYGAV